MKRKIHISLTDNALMKLDHSVIDDDDKQWPIVFMRVSSKKHFEHELLLLCWLTTTAFLQLITLVIC